MNEYALASKLFGMVTIFLFAFYVTLLLISKFLGLDYSFYRILIMVMWSGGLSIALFAGEIANDWWKKNNTDKRV